MSHATPIRLDALRVALDTLTAEARRRRLPSAEARLATAGLAVRAAEAVARAIRSLDPGAPAHPSPPAGHVDRHVQAAHRILRHLADLGAYGGVGREAHAVLGRAFPMGLDGHLAAAPRLRSRLDRQLVATLVDPVHAAFATSFGLDTLAARLASLAAERDEAMVRGETLREAVADAHRALDEAVDRIRLELAHDAEAVRAFVAPWDAFRGAPSPDAADVHDAPRPPRAAWRPPLSEGARTR